MEFMCRFGMNQERSSDQSWDGIPVVVFFGDDIQLPPVLDSPVYMPSASSPASMHGALVWKEFQTVVNLCNIVRCNEE